MTKDEAVANGFEFEGKMGVVPVYLTGPVNSTSPGAGVRGPRFLEYVLDLQDAIFAAVVYFKPDAQIKVTYTKRINGLPL